MIVKKSDLKKVLAKVNAFVSKDIVISEPPRVLFEAKDGKVEITSCNGTDFGQFRFNVDDKSELAFVTELKNLTRAASMRGDPSIEFEKDCVVFKNGDTNMVLPAQPKKSYPVDEFKVEGDMKLTLSTGDLKKLVSKISFCRDEKDNRLFLSGMRMKFDGSVLKADTTDSHRAMSNFYDFKEDKGFQFEGVLSPKAISMIENLEDGQSVTVAIDKGALELENESITIYTPLINAQFPKKLDTLYGMVKDNAEFTIDKNDILESLGLFAMCEDKSLVFEGEGDKVTIHQEDGITEIKDVIPMSDFKGKDFRFCMDLDHIREVFQNIKEGSTRLHFIFDEECKTIKVYDDENFVGLLNPMKKEA